MTGGCLLLAGCLRGLVWLLVGVTGGVACLGSWLGL